MEIWITRGRRGSPLTVSRVTRVDVPGGRWGIDNPDTQYFFVSLEAGSSYVITGKRRNPGPIDANFSFSNLSGWRTLANISQKQLQIAPELGSSRSHW